MLPLEMLTIAAYPLQDGYEIVIIDGSLHAGDHGHRLFLEACEGAMMVGTTGILGYMVNDGFLAMGKVKERFPNLPAVIGGWFASVRPDLQLETGFYEAVIMGQGELTFRDVVRAIDAGEPLDDIEGLALMRDGQVIKTPRRAVADWAEIPDVPWHLLDIEPYKQHQMRAQSARDVLRLPTPPLDWLRQALLRNHLLRILRVSRALHVLAARRSSPTAAGSPCRPSACWTIWRCCKTVGVLIPCASTMRTGACRSSARGTFPKAC